MRGKEIITKLIIPGAIAMIICLIVHPMCMNGEILDWRKLLLFVGIPFGIQKMFLLVVPRNVGTGEMLGLVVLKLEYEDQVQERELQKFLGLDFSMHELYRDSNGKEPAYPRYYRNAEKKLAREQRKLSKMQKGSNNRNKQRLKVAKLHEKVSNQRKDFLHKQSRQITNAYDCVCIEDLDMKAMSRSLNFGKSVSDNGW